MSNKDEPPAKKQCTSGTRDASLLSDFSPSLVLSCDTRSKSAAVLGSIRSSKALVLLEKSAFCDEKLCAREAFFSSDNAAETKINFVNDAYSDLEFYPLPHHNGVKATIICPATEKQIAKYTRQERYIVLETPEIYKNITLPYIEKDLLNFQWIFNILDGESEQDRILHDDKCERDGFVLLPDIKWDGTTKESLHVIAVARRRGLKSLRDLTAAELPLLRNVRDQSKKVILEKYKLTGNQLRAYFHYQPTFYHLHVHFTFIRHEPPGIFVEKAHLLDTVIDNIEMMSDYYQKASLSFTVRKMDNIYKELIANGHISLTDDENGVTIK